MKYVFATLAVLGGLALVRAELPSTKTGEWTYWAGDLKGTRYSPLSQINADNFNKIEVAWRLKTDNFGTRPEYKLEGTPLMVNGVVYTTAGTRRDAIALDAKTGKSCGFTACTKASARRFLRASFPGTASLTGPMATATNASCSSLPAIVLWNSTLRPASRFLRLASKGIVDLKIGLVHRDR